MIESSSEASPLTQNNGDPDSPQTLAADLRFRGARHRPRPPPPLPHSWADYDKPPEPSRMGIPLAQLDGTAPPSPLPVKPAWRLAPVSGQRATKLPTDELTEQINTYFTETYEAGRRPALCDLAGAVGFDSVTQLVNFARRKGGETMRVLARGLLAVSAEYEELALEGSRNAMQLLSLLPQFDSDEPASQAPQRPFMPQREINLNITGVQRTETRGEKMSEQEAYLKLIKYHTYEEISAEVLEAEQSEDGDYQVLDLESE